MRLPSLVCAAWLGVTMASTAGNIVGVVRAQGRTDLPGGAAGGKYDSRKFKFAEKVDYASFRDFVVYIDETPTNKPAPPSAPVSVVTQKDAAFRPHVVPVVAGTTIAWPNQDDIFHNVFSVSDAKSFDLGLYKTERKEVTFDRPGRVDVFCSIHKDMHCVVLVLETPYFAPTDAQARYVIRNVPAGTYRLKAWHERVPAQVRTVTVPKTGDVRVDFLLGFGLPPPP